MRNEGSLSPCWTETQKQVFFIIRCMSNGRSKVMSTPAETVHRKLAGAKATAANSDPELEEFIARLLKQCQSPGAEPHTLAAAQGLGRLPIPVVGPINIWEACTIFPNSQQRLWYPRMACLQWTGSARASGGMLFVACAFESCSNMITKTDPDAVPQTLRSRMRARPGIPQQLPPWRLCGQESFLPDNGPPEDAQPAYVKGRV